MVPVNVYEKITSNVPFTSYHSSLPPWQKEVMLLVALVCLLVSERHYSIDYARIAITFYGEVRGNTRLD